MPDQDTVRVVTADGKLWDIPKASLPKAMSRGAKVAPENNWGLGGISHDV